MPGFDCYFLSDYCYFIVENGGGRGAFIRGEVFKREYTVFSCVVSAHVSCNIGKKTQATNLSAPTPNGNHNVPGWLDR